jgi:hypothetical protein
MTAGRTGLNVSRILVGGRRNDVSSGLRDTIQGGVPPTLSRAVVVDVIINPETLTQEERNQIKDSISNREFVDEMPPNSIIAKIISDGISELNSLPSLFYPFFQSHFSLPVIPGEHVFIIFEDIVGSGISLGRWFTRVHENNKVEDLNYTHSDRRFFTNRPTAERTSTARSEERPRVPDFPNGGNTNDSHTLVQQGTENPYNLIARNSPGSRMHKFEPVPHYVKRPDEFTLSGMNNSLIVLGSDRNTDVILDTENEFNDSSGRVSIITGRGRNKLAPTENVAPPNKSTSAIVFQNERNNLEVDKTPEDRRRQRNQKEGNFDYQNDAAQFYVAQRWKADILLKTQHSTDVRIGTSYPENVLRPTQPMGDGLSYVIGKADNIRFIARKANNINGSFLLLKEGTSNEMCFIYGDPTGKLELFGQEIFFGQATQKNEPYIKYTEFVRIVTDLQTQVDNLTNFMTRFLSSFDNVWNLTTCVPFAKDPANVAAGVVFAAKKIEFNNIVSQNTNLKTDLETRRDNSVKSTRIFGE